MHLIQPLRLGRKGKRVTETPPVFRNGPRVITDMTREIERCKWTGAEATATRCHDGAHGWQCRPVRNQELELLAHDR
jgi:hypothetical protein